MLSDVRVHRIRREKLRLWRVNGLRKLPDRANLVSVARIIGQPYRQVLSAALFDTGYLAESDIIAPRPYGEVLHDAVAVLTEAAHLANHPVRQTSSGQWEPTRTRALHCPSTGRSS